MIVCTAGSWKNKYYIGQHTTKNLDDGYKGSGTLLKKYYKKYPNDYVKSIICFCDSQEQLDEREKYCISCCLDHKDCLNIAKGGKNYVGINCCYRMSQEEYKNHCSNISKSLMGHKGANPFCNMSDEDKQQWKIENSKRHKGMHHTDVTKQKISKNKTGVKLFTDGYTNIYAKPNEWGELIDIGFTFIQTYKKYNKNIS